MHLHWLHRLKTDSPDVAHIILYRRSEIKLELLYCRFGNVRKNLIFDNVREIVASRIQSSR